MNISKKKSGFSGLLVKKKTRGAAWGECGWGVLLKSHPPLLQKSHPSPSTGAGHTPSILPVHAVDQMFSVLLLQDWKSGKYDFRNQNYKNKTSMFATACKVIHATDVLESFDYGVSWFIVVSGLVYRKPGRDRRAEGRGPERRHHQRRRSCRRSWPTTATRSDLANMGENIAKMGEQLRRVEVLESFSAVA